MSRPSFRATTPATIWSWARWTRRASASARSGAPRTSRWRSSARPSSPSTSTTPRCSSCRRASARGARSRQPCPRTGMTDDPSTVLLIEDDDATRTFLADNLTADGYDLLVAETIREGTRLLETRFPDVAVVDVGLPDGSGLDLVRQVREADGLASRIDPDTPLLVLSGRAGDVDRVRGFERGADDYVAKPFAYPELRLRVAALLPRAQGPRGPGCLRRGH